MDGKHQNHTRTDEALRKQNKKQKHNNTTKTQYPFQKSLQNVISDRNTAPKYCDSIKSVDTYFFLVNNKESKTKQTFHCKISSFCVEGRISIL